MEVNRYKEEHKRKQLIKTEETARQANKCDKPFLSLLTLNDFY